MSFRKQVTNSAVWVGISTVAIKLLAFISVTLVLARVLSPKDFGVVGVAWLAINTLEYFREMGVASALVYWQKDDDGMAADVAYIAILISSFVTYAIVFLLAPAVAYFFQDTAGIVPVLRVLGLVTIINGVSQVPYTLLAKQLDFRNKAIPEIVGGIANAVLAVVLALSGFGVWSIVAGYLADAIARSSLIWFFTTWRPRWRFDRVVWREMMGYGRHVVGSRLLIFGITNIDDLFVGRFLGTTAFGFYTFAYRLSNVPATHVTGFLNNLMFPAFSRIQNDRDRVRRGFFETLHGIGLVTIPLAVGTFALGPNFVHNYYGGKWDAAIIPLVWLTIYGLMRSISANLGSIYRALGKPEWLTNLALWRFLTMLILLYPAIRWNGIIGVAMLSGIVSVVDMAIAAWGGNKLMGGGYVPYFRELGPTFLVACVTALVAYLLLPYLPAPHRLFPFLVSGTVMVTLYAIIMAWLDLRFRMMGLSALFRLGQLRLMLSQRRAATRKGV